jgi:hypothetical protein
MSMNQTLVHPEVPRLRTTQIVRHELDAKQVQACVQARVAHLLQHDLPNLLDDAEQVARSYERAIREGTTHHWPRAPQPLAERQESIRCMVQQWVDLEQHHPPREGLRPSGRRGRARAARWIS